MHQLLVPRGCLSQSRIGRPTDDGPFHDGIAQQFADDLIDVGLLQLRAVRARLDQEPARRLHVDFAEAERRRFRGHATGEQVGLSFERIKINFPK